MVSNFNKGLLLSWKNPSSKTLNGIKVYDITDGENTFITSDFSLTPSSYVHYPINGLTVGKDYQYRVIYSFSDRKDTVYYLTGKTIEINEPSGNENKNLTVTSGAKTFGKWSVDIKNQSYKGASSATPVYEKRQPFKYMLDAKNTANGSGASLKLEGAAADGENTTAFPPFSAIRAL